MLPKLESVAKCGGVLPTALICRFLAMHHEAFQGQFLRTACDKIISTEVGTFISMATMSTICTYVESLDLTSIIAEAAYIVYQISISSLDSECDLVDLLSTYLSLNRYLP